MSVVHAERRFGGVARLYGPAALERLAAAQVVVVGVGGVGSWAVEALARSGIGRLTLVDMDHVAESNINRQVHALDSTLGAAKIGVLRARIADISPHCRVECIDEFATADNVPVLIDGHARAVIDAIDVPRVKAALIASCTARRQPIVSCGAAGGRVDPLALRRTDMTLARGDALLASVRSRLRREHGFTRGAGVTFGVPAIWSPEPSRGTGSAAEDDEDVAPGAPLACAGYGSIVTVTAAMGLAAAAWAIEVLMNDPSPAVPSSLAGDQPGSIPT